jgi:hypothetical protein
MIAGDLDRAAVARFILFWGIGFQCGALQHARDEHEIQLARKIQQEFLPSEFPLLGVRWIGGYERT